ncbi:hypothetical protein [Bacteroides sp.]|uniref:hypothetical protein n=1 Tax=Bacteroides sp. TaxID=29523 RepID=UPI003AB5968E
MTEKQIKIADRLLGILVEHDGRVNKDSARSLLLKEFAERMDKIDINFVLDTLIDDYKLVSLLGEGWLRLTPEGEKMARRGMKNYQQKLSIKEWWKESKTAAILISFVSTLIGSVITVLITALLG